LVHFIFMKNSKILLASILCVLLGTLLFAQTKASPKITVWPEKILHHGHVTLKGTGFSPKSNVLSHLKRPGGREFPVLTMYTNDKGEIEHDIDTVVMEPGVHEVWVEDPKTNTTSNVATFEVTMYSKDLEK
jgi:hypothetical protein